MDDARTGAVIAVAVAHARAESLERLLTALTGQTRPPDRILIVDSDAQPDVKEVLDRWRAGGGVDVHILGHNGGSAGGFAAGLLAAAEDADGTWIAAFDDDAIPAPDCLERLLAAAGAGLASLGAVGAVSKNAEGEFAWPMYVLGRRDPLRTDEELRAFAGDKPAVAVAELAWHALVLPMATVRQLGPPRAELFMWYEDVEYGLRLRRAGLTPYVVPAASVEHPPPSEVVRGRFLGVHLDVPVVTPSKAYLMTRNALVVRHEYMGWRFWPIDMPLTLLRGLIAARALPGSTLRIGWDAIVRAVRDAARGRLGPPPAATIALDRSR
jgi:rhamnopyranosyl-N-acetylglucosaminyl-diphospho-decaprenol beta-1,3/1,4-galactofuranosyltransferase